MTAIELKKRLIKEINQTQNNELLEEMLRLITNEETDDNIYELSDAQIIAIEEAQLQFKNGQFISDEKADNEIVEWLGK